MEKIANINAVRILALCRKMVVTLACMILVSAASRPICAQIKAPTSGTLTGRFVYVGQPILPNLMFSELAELQANSELPRDSEGRVSGTAMLYQSYLKENIRPKTDDGSLLVDKDGGVANIVVWVVSKQIPWSPPADLSPVTLQVKDGNFTPRITTITVGQPLLIENLDPVQFHIYAEFMKALNPSLSALLKPVSAESPLRLTFRSAENYPTIYSSNLGPWAKGILFVHANSFVAVTQSDGTFALPNLPPGEWEFRAWHERAGFLSVWPKGLFKLKIQPGGNDLGTITLKPEQLGQVVAAGNAKITPPQPREQIGLVLGKPVYRDQIQGNNLPELFFDPVRLKYRKEHQAELIPTPTELKFAAEYYEKYFRKQLETEGGENRLRERLHEIESQLVRDGLKEEDEQKLEAEHRVLRDKLNLTKQAMIMAHWSLTNWKGQKHLYETFGGGRMLIGKFGHEAFDAGRKQMEMLEAQGEFSIDDPTLRGKVYEHWSRDYGNRLKDDKADIRQMLLEPEFVLATEKK